MGLPRTYVLGYCRSSLRDWRFFTLDGLSLGGQGVALLPVGPDEPDDGCHQGYLYADMEAVENFFEAGIGFPGAAQPHSYVGQG